jgi:hypothetical protein
MALLFAELRFCRFAAGLAGAAFAPSFFLLRDRAGWAVVVDGDDAMTFGSLRLAETILVGGV